MPIIESYYCHYSTTTTITTSMSNDFNLYSDATAGYQVLLIGGVHLCHLPRGLPRSLVDDNARLGAVDSIPRKGPNPTALDRGRVHCPRFQEFLEVVPQPALYEVEPKQGNPAQSMQCEQRASERFGMRKRHFGS
eukprot:5626041-Pyramimonas_sp.AAC.1